MDEPVRLSEKLAGFSETWSPRIVAALNDYEVMVVKARGAFVWHSHPETDDFFLLLKGRLRIEMPERSVTLGPGDLYVVPKGVEHRPVAEEDCEILLIEPKGTPNTGDSETAVVKQRI